MALPEHIDVSNAGQIREQLLTLINRGADALIADMTATISCDYAGAAAIARAYQRAVASGTELRLVVISPVIRRVLGLSGVDQLVPVYPVLDASLVARGPNEAWQAFAEANDGVPGRLGAGRTDLAAARQAYPSREFLDHLTARLYRVGLILEEAAELPRDTARQRVAAALGHLDDAVREIRAAAFIGHDQDPALPPDVT